MSLNEIHAVHYIYLHLTFDLWLYISKGEKNSILLLNNAFGAE